VTRNVVGGFRAENYEPPVEELNAYKFMVCIMSLRIYFFLYSISTVSQISGAINEEPEESLSGNFHCGKMLLGHVEPHYLADSCWTLVRMPQR
jgi:hypothetical protein